MPDSLDGVELWRIGWEVEHLDFLAVVGEPCPDGFVFVVRSIILDEIDFPWEILAQYFFEVGDVGHGIKDLLEMIQEPCAIKFDGSKDFEGIALTHR